MVEEGKVVLLYSKFGGSLKETGRVLELSQILSLTWRRRGEESRVIGDFLLAARLTWIEETMDKLLLYFKDEDSVKRALTLFCKGDSQISNVQKCFVQNIHIRPCFLNNTYSIILVSKEGEDKVRTTFLLYGAENIFLF